MCALFNALRNRQSAHVERSFIIIISRGGREPPAKHSSYYNDVEIVRCGCCGFFLEKRVSTAGVIIADGRS